MADYVQGVADAYADGYATGYSGTPLADLLIVGVSPRDEILAYQEAPRFSGIVNGILNINGNIVNQDADYKLFRIPELGAITIIGNSPQDVYRPLANIIEVVSKARIVLSGGTLGDIQWSLYENPLGIQDGTLSWFGQDSVGNNETAQSATYETLGGGYSLGGSVLEGDIVSITQGIDLGLLDFIGLDTDNNYRPQADLVQSVLNGNLLFLGNSPISSRHIKTDYWSGVSGGELNFNGTSPQAYYTGRGGKAAALKLGLFSGADVWSIPLRKYNQKFQGSVRQKPEIVVDLSKETAELELLKLQLQELEQSIGKTIGNISKIEARKALREKEKRVRKLRHEYLLSEDEEILLLLL